MLNKAQIIGRVGKDPDVRYAANGTAIANLSIATTETWKDKNTGEKKEATEWHRVTFFDKLAEIVGQYVTKGSLLYVEGKLTTRKYTDSSGIEKYTTEIRASEMKMLGGKGESEGSQAPARAPARAAAPARATEKVAVPAGGSGGFDDMDDDIPF